MRSGYFAHGQSGTKLGAKDGQDSYGAVLDDRVVDLREVFGAFAPDSSSECSANVSMGQHTPGTAHPAKVWPAALGVRGRRRTYGATPRRTTLQQI